MDDGLRMIDCKYDEVDHREDKMTYKFEQLEVWKLALDYVDAIYLLTEGLPRSEEYNLKSQIIRAATSIALNIAEGSQGQTDPEQARFLGYSIRSLIETVACQHLIRRRKYLKDESLLNEIYLKSQTLARRLQAFRKNLAAPSNRIREEPSEYLADFNIPDPSSIVHRPSLANE
jgi:four helix bundle protein